jgi:hypothetical protein
LDGSDLKCVYVHMIYSHPQTQRICSEIVGDEQGLAGGEHARARLWLVSQEIGIAACRRCTDKARVRCLKQILWIEFVSVRQEITNP